MKNQYAAKLVAAKAAIHEQEKTAIITKTVQIMFEVFGIAINRSLGIGPDRFVKVLQEADEIYAWYADMQKTDVEYADAKLREVYNDIMVKKKGKTDGSDG